MNFAKRICFLALMAISADLLNGCVVVALYGPRTYYIPQTSNIVAPFERVSVSFNTNASGAPLNISIEDSDSSKLKHLRFVSATITNEDGEVTQLRVSRASLENPNSFRMDFYKADYLGHDLHFHLNLLSEGKVIEVTFQTRFESKVVWPKDSDYSG